MILGVVNNLASLKSLNDVKLNKSIRQTQDKEKISEWLLKN